MLTQEDLFVFFENMAKELRDENIPIMNIYGAEEKFPGVLYRDEIRKLIEENKSDNEDEIEEQEPEVKN